MTISATDILVPVCFKTPLLYLLTQKNAQKFGYVLGIEWKRERNGSTALLLKGAHRVGKSTAAKAFAENEYKSYILIDFVQASKEVKLLFDNLMELNYIFLRLQSIYQVILEPRKSAIIFDEVQMCPQARQAIIYPIS